MARIPEITEREQLPEAQRGNWDAIAASRGSVRGPFAVLLNSPELASRAAHLGTYLRFESPLEPAVKEFTVLCTAGLQECNYEWSAHEPQARKAGVSEEAIKAIRERRPEALAPEQRELFELVQEIVERHRVSAERFERAKQRFGVQGLVDVVGTVGYYSLLATALNTFEVEPAAAAV
jgi:4-carboxymuconolactone decarboxylase